MTSVAASLTATRAGWPSPGQVAPAGGQALAARAFAPLPLGAIRPEGWLLRQLRIQASGLTGHLDEFWPDIAESQWFGGKAEGWERAPYWLDGAIPLAWLLDDGALKARITKHVAYVIDHQRDDGWYGPYPTDAVSKRYDLWAILLVNKVLAQYHDATGDPRAIEAVAKSLRALSQGLERTPLYEWGRFRWYEGLVPIFYVYERQPEPWLLELARTLRSQGVDYEAMFRTDDLMVPTPRRGLWKWTKHVVNTAMATKASALSWRLDQRPSDRAWSTAMIDFLDRYHGQVNGMPEPDVFFRSAVAPGTARITGASGLTRIGASMIGVDGVTLVFTLGVAVLTAILVSLLPAAQASMLRPVDALKTAKAQGGARWVDSRAVLVATQIALALILLAGAGLMIRSAERLHETGIGVDPTGLLTVRIDLPGAAYDNNRGQQFYAQLLERVGALPGVRSAALGLCPPVSGGCNSTIAWFPPAKEPFRNGRDPSVGIHWITPGFLDTLGVKLLRGRNITDQDRAGQPKVLLVNETAARRLWPNDDPIGKRMWAGQGSAGSGDPSEVVGVVSDVRYRAIETAPVPDVYIPLAQSYTSRM